MADRDTERGAWDTRGGQPLAVHATLDDGETLSVEATDGWVRIDERTGETVRGALSWVAADDDGERLGWGEGAFEVVVCEAWRG